MACRTVALLRGLCVCAEFAVVSSKGTQGYGLKLNRASNAVINGAVGSPPTLFSFNLICILKQDLNDCAVISQHTA